MNRPSVSLPLLLAVIAALVVAYFVRATHGHQQHSPAARAMLVGKARGEAATAPEGDDKALTDDEEAAGALWARRHAGQRCPADPVAFKNGCRQTQTQ
jgi:hypothetical protein